MELPERFTPDFLRRLELLALRARRAFLGTRQGGHLSQKRGHGIEFSDYRQYELGDSPRHIDWGLYARSERLYVKRFQEEQNLTVFIVLDGSASMRTPAEDGKWEYARDTALAIAYVALMQQDSVVLCIPGALMTPALSGPQAFASLIRMVNAAPAADASRFLPELQRAMSRVRFPGVAVLVSDFLLPLQSVGAALLTLRAKNLDITAVEILGAHDLSPVQVGESIVAQDSETGAAVEITASAQTVLDYAELLAEHQKAVQLLMKDSRVKVAQGIANEPFDEFLFREFPKTGLLQ